MNYLTRLVLIAVVLLVAFCVLGFLIRFPVPGFILAAMYAGWRAKHTIRESDVHGTARWCDEAEARRGGLL